jgi:hypothetical protein
MIITKRGGALPGFKLQEIGFVHFDPHHAGKGNGQTKPELARCNGDQLEKIPDGRDKVQGCQEEPGNNHNKEG